MDLLFIGGIIAFRALSAAKALGCDKLRLRSRDHGIADRGSRIARIVTLR
jgi:hypothetical protein